VKTRDVYYSVVIVCLVLLRFCGIIVNKFY